MDPSPDIVGESEAHQRVLDDVRLIAPTSASVVLRGESGTGKELVASLIHQQSGREGSLVPINCAALPETLVDSLLFGHRRGAFTGATEPSDGLIASADGGTLFLDEIAELPLAVQARLLRVLQEGTVLPVGGVRERPVDVRIVAASHCDLRAAVAAGRFREDLYYRLARFEIVLPPLRERGRDVILVARRYLEGLGGLAKPVRLAQSAEAVLVWYSWPGNVRELQNVLFRAALRADGVIGAAELRAALGRPVEERGVERVLDVVGGGASSIDELLAATRLARSTLKRMLRELVEVGELATTGAGRATRYRRPELSAPCVDDRVRMALKLAARDGRITRQALARACGCGARTAGRVLAEMVRDGLLVPDGRRGSATGYRAQPVKLPCPENRW